MEKLILRTNVEKFILFVGPRNQSILKQFSASSYFIIQFGTLLGFVEYNFNLKVILALYLH